MFYLIRPGKNIEKHMSRFYGSYKEFKESWYKVMYPTDPHYSDVVCHRIKGPSITYKNGNELYHENGYVCKKIKTDYSLETFKIHNNEFELHSFSDNPSIVYNNGTKEWHKSGYLHRYEKPAIEYANGDQEWWYYGQRHRKDGPAVIYGNKQYWFEKDNFVKLKVLK